MQDTRKAALSNGFVQTDLGALADQMQRCAGGSARFDLPAATQTVLVLARRHVVTLTVIVAVLAATTVTLPF
jgi:hypothetical protein